MLSLGWQVTFSSPSLQTHQCDANCPIYFGTETSVLPERYGPWQTVYKRFKEWSESGLIEKIFHELGEDADLQDISIDSTYIKAHKASAGAERGGFQNPPMS